MHLVGLFLVLAFATLVTIQAECPNGCSGRGSCSSKDMCKCYKNFQGNDCSERTCGFGYAHTDTPKGDLNMDQQLTDNGVVQDSQVYPYGTYEQYNPAASVNEGHFYMECSNQGLCDREVGDCVCFDGFEGSACQRASCPNSCSNHGSCESISEFATTAKGTLFTKGLVTGTTVYDLWDAKVSYGCRCDPWFTGADCSQRLCKVGVDPMYYDTEQVTYETIVIDGITASTDGNFIRIRFWDYWGESFITDRITVSDNAKISPAQIEDAFEALPNGVISAGSVKCEALKASDLTFLRAQHVSLTDIVCQFGSNPGALRLPEIYEQSGFTDGLGADTAEIIGTPLRGEDENLCNTLHPTYSIKGIAAAGTMTVAGSDGVLLTGSVSITTVPYLVKYNDQYAVVTDDTTTTATLTLASTIFTADDADATADLYYSTTALAAAQTLSDGIATGATTTTLTFVGAHGYVAGDKIICESQIFNVVSVEDSSDGTTFAVKIDRPYFGSATGRAVTATTNCYEIDTTSRTTTYVSECAGRGLCDRESGVCSCFKGYTNDNCDAQSILAF